jgi:hypothetical protein
VQVVEYLGWAATAVFVGSYFCRTPDAMRRIQMLGAVMWMAYAVLLRAAPVFVANLLVLCAAGWTATSYRRERIGSSLAARRAGR